VRVLKGRKINKKHVNLVGRFSDPKATKNRLFGCLKIIKKALCFIAFSQKGCCKIASGGCSKRCLNTLQKHQIWKLFRGSKTAFFNIGPLKIIKKQLVFIAFSA